MNKIEKVKSNAIFQCSFIPIVFLFINTYSISYQIIPIYFILIFSYKKVVFFSFINKINSEINFYFKSSFLRTRVLQIIKKFQKMRM